MASAKNDKAAAKSLFELVGLEAEKYRLGHTKASTVHNISHFPIGIYNLNLLPFYFKPKLCHSYQYFVQIAQ